MSSFEKKLENIVEPGKETSILLETAIEKGEKRKKSDREKKRIGKKILKALPLVIVSILSLFIIGLDAFIEGVWSWENLLEPDFWYSYVNLQMAKWLMAITFLIAVLKELIASHTKYLGHKASIQVFVDHDHESEFIDRQVEIEKIIRKIYFLEIKVSRLLLKFKKRHKIGDLDDFYDKGSAITLDGIKRGKKRRILAKTKKRVKKLGKIKEMLTLEWQKNYIKGYKIKYPKISRSALVSGFTPSTREGVFSNYKSRVISTSALYMAPSTITATLFSMFIMVFDVLTKPITLGAIFTLVAKALLIFWNTNTIVSLAPSIFDTTLLRSIEERNYDLGRLEKRHNNNNANEQDILFILDLQKEK